MTIKTANHTRKQTTARKSEAANYENTYKVLQIIEDLKEIIK